MEHTRPGASFTAAVMTALPVAGNAAGSATAIAAANGAIKAGLLAKVLTFGGVFAGAAGGIAGVLFGSRKWLRDARDEEERHGLYRFTAAGIALVIVFAVMLPVSWKFTQSPIAPVVNFALFVAGLAVLQHVWLPRIIARRLAAEMIEDPERARHRRRTERRAAIIGWTLGLTFGTTGLVLGIYLSARH
jgi:hypothetical protein